MKGYFGIGIWHPKFEVNIGTLFRSALCFGASFVFTVGKRYKKDASDTPNTPSQIPLYHYLTLDSLKQHLPYSCPIIGIELEENAIPVKNFQHPRCAIYLLGAEDHGLSKDILKECHNILVIDNLKHCINVAVAGSIVMYDRQIKGVQ